MSLRDIYDVGSDTRSWFSEEIKKYVHEENLICRTKSPFLRNGVYVFTKEHESAFGHLSDDIALFLESYSIFPHVCLVQFWRVEELHSGDDSGERRFLLTTRNQPFLLGDLSLMFYNKGVFSYRMEMRDVIITEDEGCGSIGRVFRNNRMEYTPDVAYYSSKEYPQRNMALSCHIKSSLVVPLSDFCGRTIGVVEYVSRHWVPACFIHDLFILLGSVRCKDLCGQDDLAKNSLHCAVSEIKGVIKRISERFHIVYAQTWMLCKHCNSLSTSKSCAEELSASYKKSCHESYFLEIGSNFIMRKGEGVVGKAATTSQNLVYCEDVLKFSIIEYPLAHIARESKLSSSFAICLRSDHSGDQVYVLEFFFGSTYVKGRDLGATFVPIIYVMRKNFRKLKFASGGELIDSLSIQVIDASFPDKFETLETRFLDLTLPNDVNNIEAFKETLEESEGYVLQRSIGENDTNETDDDSIFELETSFQDMSVEEITVYSASTVESEFYVNVKAIYGENCFIWIQLSASSGIQDLKQLVSQRLKLAVGTYDLKYQDEDNDLIELACDEDLKYYISSSTMLENYTLMVFVVPT